MTEADVDRHVQLLARALRLIHFHHRTSIGTNPGWVDWWICGPRGILYRECKSATGKLRREQRALGYALQALGEDWAVWRPADVISGRIERELRAVTAR